MSKEYSPFAGLGLAIEIVQRLESDEEFRNKARQDPIGVLTTVGLPADLAQSLTKWGNEGLAAAAESGPCCDLTCWSSACPGTCSITAISTTTCYCASVLDIGARVRPEAAVAKVQATLERTIEQLRADIRGPV